MSIYKPQGSARYRYDFWCRGHRFFGDTQTANRREAEAVERLAREKAKLEIEQQIAARTSLRLDDICGRYWSEKGQSHAGADNTYRLLGKLLEFFGKDKLITDITDDDVAKLVVWRRGHRARKDGPLISPFTVNDTTEQLKKLFTRARTWGVQFKREPRWREHWLKEPKERVRELHEDEADRLDVAMRADYAPFFDFLRETGLRWNKEARHLRWTEVHWREGQIIMPGKGKGGSDVVVELSSAVREILAPLVGQHPEYVFTYEAQRTREYRIRGNRYPLTESGIKTFWRRLRARAGITDFRCHDFRHDFATKLLRVSNLRVVQHALNHADIKTTVKYAHAMREDLREALERKHERAESHKQPHNPKRKTG
jgi:integrase